VPIYEYGCQKCGKRTEAIQRVGEKPLRICPHCGGKYLKKLHSAPAIQFKGSGWYVTDYARAKKEEKGEPAAASAKTETSEKPSEKPAAEKKKEHKEKKTKD
jgi:putative FmdB family regulatory protein